MAWGGGTGKTFWRFSQKVVPARLCSGVWRSRLLPGSTGPGHRRKLDRLDDTGGTGRLFFFTHAGLFQERRRETDG